MKSGFNDALYNESIQTLTENGVPLEVARRASQVIATDQAGMHNLGRTQGEQADVDEALKLLRGTEGHQSEK